MYSPRLSTATSRAAPAVIDEALQRVGGYTALPALMQQLGIDPGNALASADLEPDALDDPEDRVAYSAVGRLLGEAATRARCAHFGLLAGRVWHLADLGLPGELARHSATVGDALRTLSAYQHLNSGGETAFLISHGASVDLGYAIYLPGISGADQIYDAVLAGGFNFMRDLCGPGWLPTEVLLSRAKPFDTKPYVNLFKVQPRFNSEFCALRFPAHWMQKPVEGADPARFRQLQLRAETAQQPPLLHQVYRALRILLLEDIHSGDAVAQMLSMHRRTLNRRLKMAGTTFQDVLDEVRLEVARQLLSGSEISLDDVAATLGYASVSPFMRAFRRWTKTTPDQWRRAAALRPGTQEAPGPHHEVRASAPQVVAGRRTR
jgi:AraC-like DNA-binding protein